MGLDARMLREEDAKLSAQQRGSVVMVAGWVILGMGLFCGLLTFATFRDGTVLWRYMTFAMWIVGFGMVIWGAHDRKVNS